jgi:hypothetical protein
MDLAMLLVSNAIADPSLVQHQIAFTERSHVRAAMVPEVLTARSVKAMDMWRRNADIVWEMAAGTATIPALEK